jgi:hypothetical protein
VVVRRCPAVDTELWGSSRGVDVQGSRRDVQCLILYMFFDSIPPYDAVHLLTKAKYGRMTSSTTDE